MFCYNVYQIIIQTTNVWDWEKNNTNIFYSLNKTGISFILNMFYLQIENIMINYAILLWC